MILIKFFRKFLCLALILLSIFFTGCQKTIYHSTYTPPEKVDSAISGRLTLNGSTSMTKICNSLGEAFMEMYPGVSVEKADTGSGSAVKAVLDSTAIIGDLSRELKESEQNEKIDSRIIALDGIAVIVNHQNPVQNVSKEQLKDIFSGKITNWSELGGNNGNIRLIGREASSGTRDGFESILGLSKTPPKYDAEYPETGDVVSKVGNDVNTIGYCSLFSVSGNIKALSIDYISISEETISDTSYPIQRPFIQVYDKTAGNKLVSEWFAFVNSETGKDLIRREKLVPVKIEPVKEVTR